MSHEHNDAYVDFLVGQFDRLYQEFTAQSTTSQTFENQTIDLFAELSFSIPIKETL